MNNISPANMPKWTDLEYLPEWDEEFYDIYTAKKYGKWVMLKTLKPQFKQDPYYQAMIEKEFDVRYNLAHPGIVMINDFEELPELGRCIITDDVYGESLRKLINKKEVGKQQIEKICTQLIDALDYIQLNHIVHYPIKPETIIFTENVGNLKLIDVGFDQKESLTPADASDDIYCFGKILSEAINQVENVPGHLKKIAEKCMAPNPSDRYQTVHALRMALAKRSDNTLYVCIILFLVLMIGVLIWLNSTNAPAHHSLSLQNIISHSSIISHFYVS